jgi:hypothetical protein
MSSKIIIIGVGCASSMRARPPRSRHAGNPRERLRAKDINWATAALTARMRECGYDLPPWKRSRTEAGGKLDPPPPA